MADLSQHRSYSANYSGLLDNLYVTAAIAAVCLVGYEIEVHIPRRRGRDGTYQRVVVRLWHSARRGWDRWRGEAKGFKEDKERPSTEVLMRGHETTLMDEKRKRLGDREGWEFGYIYQPKAWALNAAPPVPLWPLAWIPAALKVRERDMPEKCGLDLTLHMRFIRGSFFYTLLQASIIVPILMPLHIIYAPDTISKTSMLRAGISSLVESSGSKWLWVHAVLIWWISITWTLTVLWMTWGGLAYRRREIGRLEERVRESRRAKKVLSGNEEGVQEADRWTAGDECEGIKRYRTLMVSNVPPDMRDEDTLRDYFDFYIHRHRARNSPGPCPPRFSKEDPSKMKQILSPVANPGKLWKKKSEPKANPPPVTPDRLGTNGEDVAAGDNEEAVETDSEDETMFETEVDEVVLVRKLGSLASLRQRRTKVLKQLETAHVQLAKRVLKAVGKHQAKHHGNEEKSANGIQPIHDVESGVDGLNAARNEGLREGITKIERLDRLTAALGKFVGDGPEQRGEGKETVWDVLHSLPRELLDPYQSLTHLKATSVFRDQNAPLIDFLTTKLAYLTTLLDQARAESLSSFPTSSTAFVTFKDARTARLALKILDSHPKRSLACHTVPAPDWTDLLWNRLGMSTYRSEFVRGWVVFLAVWAFTLIWIFPVSLICALTTITNISGFIPPLKAWLDANPKGASAIASLAPVILVALLTIAICPILLAVANKAEAIVTKLGIHNSVLERFWKFLMVNGVVFFAIGQSAIETYLTAFQTADFDPLPIVASSFPSAAPYFASYILLQTAIQPCFEIFRFGLPTIIYVFATRVAKIPRQRNGNTEYPTFSHFSQVPMQLLAGAIMHLFMLLNPLVIPFALVYYGALYVVWKRQFTYVYGRLYENNGRRTSIRVLRYSLDALALGQFVLFAFFILNKAKGNAIATGILFFLTLIEKLIITRALKRRHDNLDIEEADILCPPVPRDNDDPTRIDPSLDDSVSLEDAEKQRPPSRPANGTILSRSKIHDFFGKWVYASSHRNVRAGYRKPIPFDHLLFARLDRFISFPVERSEAEKAHGHAHLVSDPVHDAELHHSPDHAIAHEAATRIVLPHHPVRPWEDIPPYQRSRGYNDQPAYTDDYDDFIWLPRDPLSTLDLDDTVEVRLALTTSAGGSGKFGNWPPDETETMMEKEAKQQHGEEILVHPEQPDGAANESSPLPTSEWTPLQSESDPLPPSEPIDISPEIGSEADENPASQLFKTIRMRQTLGRAFNRPGAHNRNSDDAIDLRTLSRTSTQGITPAVQTAPVLGASVQESPQQELTQAEVLSSAASGSRLPTANAEVATEPGSAPPKTGSAISFRPSLGRDPSGRRPSQRREGSQSNVYSGSGIGSPFVRSTSAFSGHARRDGSHGTISAHQQALLHEVMEEERLASLDAKKQETEEREKEAVEVRKEKERIASVGEGSGSVMARRGTRMDAVGSGRRPSRLGVEGLRRQSRAFSGGSGMSGASAAPGGVVATPGPPAQSTQNPQRLGQGQAVEMRPGDGEGSLTIPRQVSGGASEV